MRAPGIDRSPGSTRGRLGIVPVVVAAALGACEPDPAPDTRTAVRDSAGVRIVENAAEPAARWGAREAVRVGELDGPESVTFNRIADLEVAGDRVYVLDGPDGRIKAYTRAGEHAFSFGGAGEGPAEFLGASQLLLRGDSLTVYDHRLVKLAHFDLAGELIGTQRPRFSEGGLFLGAGVEPIPGGFAAWTASGSCRLPPPEDLRTIWTLFTTGPDGTPVDTIAVATGRSGVAAYLPDLTGCTVVSRLAGRAWHVSVARDGRIAYADGDRYEIHVVDASRGPAILDNSAPSAGSPSGARPSLIVRRSVDPSPVTASERAAHRDRIFDPERPFPLSPALARAVEAAWDTTPEFATWPHFSALRFDDGGRLWARRTYRAGEATATWDVFGPDGVLGAEAVLPSRLEVRLIESGTVWGVERAHLGIEQIVGYTLVRAEGNGLEEASAPVH